jgi:hypothetical protein
MRKSAGGGEIDDSIMPHHWRSDGPRFAARRVSKPQAIARRSKARLDRFAALRILMIFPHD